MNDKPTTPEAIWAADMAKEIMNGMDAADGANDGQISYDAALRYLDRASRDALREQKMDRANAFIRAEMSIRKSHQKNPERTYFRVADALIDKEFAVSDGVVRIEIGKRGGHFEVEVPVAAEK